jgi:hypothetical protein
LVLSEHVNGSYYVVSIHLQFQQNSSSTSPLPFADLLLYLFPSLINFFFNRKKGHFQLLYLWTATLRLFCFLPFWHTYNFLFFLLLLVLFCIKLILLCIILCFPWKNIFHCIKKHIILSEIFMPWAIHLLVYDSLT